MTPRTPSRTHPSPKPLRAWVMGLALATAASAQASTPAEKVVCTQAPRHTWLSEAQARHRFGAERYLLVRFKVSRGQCHEFYAVERDGSVVEAYQHPVTGEIIRQTRIPAKAPAASNT